MHTKFALYKIVTGKYLKVDMNSKYFLSQHLLSSYSLIGTLYSKATIVDIMDKGKGANILCDGEVTA